MFNLLIFRFLFYLINQDAFLKRICRWKNIDWHLHFQDNKDIRFDLPHLRVNKTIPDLFFQDKDIKYFPTSTCVPFSKKIFLTVQGKILPCEKVGQQYPLGYVRDGKINLDSKEVKQLYLKLYTPIVDKCKKCLLWKNCEICVCYLPKAEEGQTVCP